MFKAINAINEQTTARVDAVKTVLTGLDERTKHINDNTDKNTKEIIKLQRLTACLLVAHDINLPVNMDLREQCARDIMATDFAPPSTPNGENKNSLDNGGQPPATSSPGGGGNGSDEPEPQSILPGVDEPVLGCVGELCL